MALSLTLVVSSRKKNPTSPTFNLEIPQQKKKNLLPKSITYKKLTHSQSFYSTIKKPSYTSQKKPKETTPKNFKKKKNKLPTSALKYYLGL